MELLWNRDGGILTYNGKSIRVLCLVRNELNGLRAISEKPVFSEDEEGGTGVPYMPRLFPKGSWTVETILPKDNPYEAPQFISTNAHQLVDEWSVEDGHYGKPTGNHVEDWGYGLHNSSSSTTLGCGHILESQDRADLVAAIEDAWSRGENVTLEVV